MRDFGLRNLPAERIPQLDRRVLILGRTGQHPLLARDRIEPTEDPHLGTDPRATGDQGRGRSADLPIFRTRWRVGLLVLRHEYVMKSPCCAEPTPSPAWTGQTERSSLRSSRGCRRCCGGIAQASTMLACDFFPVDCAVTLQRISVFFVLEMPSRCVYLLDTTRTPTVGGPPSRSATW